MVGETDINQISTNYNYDKEKKHGALRASRRDFTYCVYSGKDTGGWFEKGFTIEEIPKLTSKMSRSGTVKVIRESVPSSSFHTGMDLLELSKQLQLYFVMILAECGWVNCTEQPHRSDHVPPIFHKAKYKSTDQETNKNSMDHSRDWHANIYFLVIESVDGNINFFEYMDVFSMLF